MGRNTLILFCCFLFVSFKLLAQADAYSGTWYMEYLQGPGMSPIQLQLQIATSERNILYPANLRLQCDSFIADYELLLVKKNSRELGISRNKYPRSEKPFSLGNWSFFLGGSFDLSKDLKGTPTLTALRIQSRQLVDSLPVSLNFTETQRTTVKRLRGFLKDAEIRLTKINNIPWGEKNRDSILSPVLSPAYFGLRDTIYLPKRDGIIILAADKKKDNDVVSVSLNGQLLLDMIALNKKNHIEEILLSPGLNILTLFADNFGGALPNKGKLNLEFGNRKFSLDFANKADSAATFIVAKLYCDPDQSKERYFKENTIPGEEKSLQKNEKLIGSIISTSPHLTFAIWDEVIEDGDSISISINGNWLIRGCPVRTNPKFIAVTLKPGPNNIIFMADNLGSIPPNTSALEIIDGKRRKYFAMETRPGEKNIVKIFYDSKIGL